MLYLKGNQLIYHTISNGALYYDMYNFERMDRNETAYKGFMDSVLINEGFTSISPDETDRYTLTLDFLSNANSQQIKELILSMNTSILELNFQLDTSTGFVLYQTFNLKIEDLINIIQDNNFQVLNKNVSVCSIWKVHKV